MANRISLPRPSISFDGQRVVDAAHRAASWRIPRGEELKLLLYRIGWLPLWLGSDLPAPVLPEQDARFPSGGLAGDHVAIHLARIARRVWLLRTFSILVRALWLPILIGCGWLAIELLGGPELRPWALPWIGAALLIPAAVFAYLERPTKRQIAYMLDRSFGLQDRMVTAVDHFGKLVPAPGEHAPITYLQMADAANIITELKTHPAFKIRPPVRELVLGIASALLLASLFFMRGVGGGIPLVSDGNVPAFVHAADRLAKAQQQPAPQADAALADAPTVAEVQDQAKNSTQAQQALKQIANALADQAVTHAASDAINAGNYSEAASLLHDVADHADQLSESARTGLADNLDQAASAMADSNPDLSKAAQDAANGLRQGGDAAKQGMNELANAVDQTAQSVIPQSQQADDMKRAEAADQQRATNGEQSTSSDSTNSNGNSSSGDPSAGTSDQSQSASSQNGSSSSGSSSGTDAQSGDPNGDQSGTAKSNQGSGSQSSSNGDNSNASSQQGPAADGYGQVKGKSASSTGDSGSSAQPGDGSAKGASGEGSDNTDGKSGASGGGAGSGDGSNQSQDGSKTGAATGGATSSGDPTTQTNVTQGQPGSGGDPTAPAEDPHDALTLNRAPDSSGQQTNGNGGGSSTGSGGGGASVSQGTTTQGDVGVAGPDSNRVPSEYRGVVEDYFSQDGS